MTCATCGLYRCACRSGKTTVTAAGATADEARIVAEGYLTRRGWAGELVAVRRRQAKVGLLGYRAWDLQFRVRRGDV